MIRVLALSLILACPALADAPLSSPVPQPRPSTDAGATKADVSSSSQPMARPDQTEAAFTPLMLQTGPLVSPLPKRRPKNVTVSQPATPASKTGAKTKTAGAMCSDSRLSGEVIADFGEKGGCGISDGVRVKVVSGVALSSPALVDCKTAVALADWLDDVAKPAFRNTGGGLAKLQVYASYSCRPRNNQSGARLSEHGKGHAIDIGGFVTAKGQDVSVLKDWGKGKAGGVLKKLRQGACGIFGTVLGPGSDAFHRNHFHFDTARYRKGAYCK